MYSEQVRGLPGRTVFIFRCELFGLAGYYSIFLRPINPDPIIPRTSAYVKVRKSDLELNYTWTDNWKYFIRMRSLLNWKYLFYNNLAKFVSLIYLKFVGNSIFLKKQNFCSVPHRKNTFATVFRINPSFPARKIIN